MEECKASKKRKRRRDGMRGVRNVSGLMHELRKRSEWRVLK